MRIYYMDMEEECTEEQKQLMFNLLPPERKELVERAKNEMIVRKRIYAGALLQYVLSEKTGLPADYIRYQYNEWGKPSLDWGKMPGENKKTIYFNMSHSGKYVVVAVNDESVGIDIECKSRNYQFVAKRFFCEKEYEDIQMQDTERMKQLRFLEYWTMKEAYVKCIGEGLQIPMNSFQIERKQGEISSIKDGNLELRTIWLTEEYCISV